MIIKVNGGLSILTAFINGHGSAISIDLPMYTHINESDNDYFESNEIKDTVDFIREKYNINKKYNIKIESEIPVAMGLKSSSAMTLSIIYGIIKDNNININEKDLLKYTAKASIYNKTSITGAIDDISSCYYGGLCITDNIKNKVLSRIKMKSNYLLIAYNNNIRKTYDYKNYNFKIYKKFYKSIEKLLNENFVYEAMVLNGYLFGSIFGYDNNIINYFLKNGAIYAGQSGKGPAIFSIYNSLNDMNYAYDNFKSNNYKLIKSRFNNDGINIISNGD